MSRYNNKPCYIYLLLAAFSVCFIYTVLPKIYWVTPNQNLKRHIQLDNETKVPKYILYWTSFFSNDVFYFGEGQEVFVDKSCNVTNCYATKDRTLLPVEAYDAVVFHGVTYCSRGDQPPVRSPHQRYVFLALESPVNMHCPKTSYADFDNFYNWTMTYRIDSDIMWPYNRFADKSTNKYVAPSRSPLWEHQSDVADPYYLEFAKTKLSNNPQKIVAWFVSNCHSNSEREVVVQKLQEHIPVDVYGACGPFSCSRDDRSKCSDMLDQEYKFYLAFENSLCTDYATEKLFNAMELNIIPIVYGGADYAKIAPPHSYINVKDFPTVEKLASYLKYLMKYPSEYAKYFTWKKYYAITSKSPFCELCEQLNDPQASYKTTIYSDIQQWWYGQNDEMCSTP